MREMREVQRDGVERDGVSQRKKELNKEIERRREVKDHSIAEQKACKVSAHSPNIPLRNTALFHKHSHHNTT